jgi:hypothetical protein
MTLLDALARMEASADEVIAKRDALPGDFCDAAFRMTRAATPERIKALIEVARAAQAFCGCSLIEMSSRESRLEEALKRLEGVLQ